jgi:hypothetical protein
MNKKYNYILQSSTLFINKHVYETMLDLELKVNALIQITKNKFRLDVEIF